MIPSGTDSPLADRATGKCRGAGLVRFETQEEAENAMGSLRGVHMPGGLNPMVLRVRFPDLRIGVPRLLLIIRSLGSLRTLPRRSSDATTGA